jgi:tetratricopeptide (TPR) repeat protein
VELKLKSISKSGIAAAISKAEIYRYLNEPGEAESICRDILAVEPDHQATLRLLGLAITDQFTGNPSDRYAETENIFQSLTDRYEKLYYTGLLHERRAKAQLRAGRAPHTLRELFEEAMHYFEEAEKLRPQDNDDAILRWNRCVRLLQSRHDSEWRKEIEAFDASEGPPI